MGRDDLVLRRAPLAQPVIDVHGDRREPAVDGEREQRGGVRPARAPDHHRRRHGLDGSSDSSRPTRRSRSGASASSARRAMVGDGQAAGAGSPRSTRASQADGVASSSTVGRNSGPRQAASSARGPPSCSTAATNCFPDLVLPHLGVDAEQLRHQATDALRSPPRLEHAGHPVLPGDVRAAQLVHDAVPVSLEHGHQRLDLGERRAVLGRREQRDDPAVVERVATLAQLVGRAQERAHQLTRVGVDAAESALDEPEEVVAHPRHTEELRAVGHLVDRDPEPEVARAEREALLERQDVGAHVSRPRRPHRRAVTRRRSSGTSRSYWPSTRWENQPRSTPSSVALTVRPIGASGLASILLAELVGERPEEPAHRRDVRLHPPAAVEDRGARVADDDEAGVLGDQGLGLRGDRGEVLRQGGSEIGVGDRVPAGDPAGDPGGERPVDRLRWPMPRVGTEGRDRGRRSRGHSTRLPRYLGTRTLRM